LFKQHTLRFEFKNNAESFDDKGNDSISLANVKATVSLNAVVGRMAATAEISIYGLSIDRLAELSGHADGNMLSTQNITVSIFADDFFMFSGGMVSSIANMNSAPETGLMIVAIANADLQKKAVSPFSANGSQPIETVISSICTAAGYEASFKGLKGMTTSSSPHYEGSVYDQLNAVCSDYNVAMQVNPPNNIEFWSDSSLRDDVVPYISKEYGLIGYPVFSNGGILFQTQYSLLLIIGRHIEIKTDLPHASGRYQLTAVKHELSSWVESGSWHTICTAVRTQEEREKAQNG
jgi:hypothetical protein